VGFTLPVDKPSLIDYKQQARYNKWEFNYDPAADQAQAMGGLTNGASNGGTPTNGAPGLTSPTSTTPSPTTGTPTSPNTDSPTSPQ